MKLNLRKIIIISYFTGYFLCCFIQQNKALGSIANRDEKKKSEIARTGEPNIVGKIDDYTITRQELEKRLISAFKPDQFKIYTEQTKPDDANSILLQMLGEKAIIIEARKQGLLEDETIRQPVMKERQKRLVNLWVQYNEKNLRDKIAATEDEIVQLMKADPKIDREKAKSTVEATKKNKILDQCYKDLYKKSNVKKVTANFSKVIEIHNRLLNHPVKPRPANFIRNYQVIEELIEDEKNLVLATFTHGKVTLREWFDILCDYSPAGRPKNLDTDDIDQLLEKALSKSLIIAEVQELGLDNNPVFLKQIRDKENELLLNYIKNKKNNDINEPTTEEIYTFYNKNKKYFVADRIIKIDQIWCKDFETAKLVKNELNSGQDFNDVKKQYSLYPESQPYQSSPDNDGYFWKEIWSGEPNEIIGPVKGFRTEEIKWRIVKILEKQQGIQQEYSKELETFVKYLMMSEMSIKNMANYCLNILKEYPYEIYSDQIKDIDLMNIP